MSGPDPEGLYHMIADMQAEIDRLQASCVEYRAELSEQDATITRLQARVAELSETLLFAARYTGLEARGCPLCRYEDGVLVEICQLHECIDRLLARDQRREQLLRECCLGVLDIWKDEIFAGVQLAARIRAELGDEE